MPPLFGRRPDVEVPDIVRRLCDPGESGAPREVRNFRIDGRRTSLRLEGPYLAALEDISRDMGVEMSVLVTWIAGARSVDNLTTAIRLFVLAYFRNPRTQ